LFPLLVSSRNPQRDMEIALQTIPYSCLGVKDIKLSHGNWNEQWQTGMVCLPIIRISGLMA